MLGSAEYPPRVPTTEADLGESVETDDLYNSFTDADFDSDNASDDSDPMTNSSISDNSGTRCVIKSNKEEV